MNPDEHMLRCLRFIRDNTPLTTTERIQIEDAIACLEEHIVTQLTRVGGA